MMTLQRKKTNQLVVTTGLMLHFYGLEEGDADLLKGFDSLNMEESSKFLNYFPQIAMTPQRLHYLYLVVNTI